jgi:hypothetical protein
MSDTFDAVLQAKTHVGESIPSKTVRRNNRDVTIAPSAAEVHKANADKSKWEWVEVPDNDIFGEEHTGVSINFEHFGPGKYFVSPEMAFEIKRLLDNRMRGDIRVLQPNKDVKMAQIMSRSLLGAPTNSELDDSQARNLKAKSIF